MHAGAFASIGEKIELVFHACRCLPETRPADWILDVIFLGRARGNRLGTRATSAFGSRAIGASLIQHKAQTNVDPAFSCVSRAMHQKHKSNTSCCCSSYGSSVQLSRLGAKRLDLFHNANEGNCVKVDS